MFWCAFLHAERRGYSGDSGSYHPATHLRELLDEPCEDGVVLAVERHRTSRLSLGIRESTPPWGGRSDPAKNKTMRSGPAVFSSNVDKESAVDVAHRLLRGP
jgi:hypothetical protein